MPHYTATYVTIAASGSTSDAADLRGQRLMAVETPAGFEGTTLAFTACATESGTFVDLYHLSTLVATATVITGVDESQHIELPFDKAPVNCFVKLVSDAAEAADRVLTLLTEPV